MECGVFSVERMMSDMAKKKKRRMRCDNCEELKESVAICTDPYQEDVNNIIVKTKLCAECYQDYCDDI